MIDHRSYIHSCEIKDCKKIAACMGLEPITSAIPVPCSALINEVSSQLGPGHILSS